MMLKHPCGPRSAIGFEPHAPITAYGEVLHPFECIEGPRPSECPPPYAQIFECEEGPDEVGYESPYATKEVMR